MSAQSLGRQIDQLILPSFPDFVRHKRLLLDPGIRYLLRAFQFDASGFDKGAVLVNVFVQPMYIPHSVVVMSLGHRVGRWHWAEGNAGDIVRAMAADGGSFLARLKTPSSLSDSRLFGSDNLLALEAMAYGLYLDGRVTDADDKLLTLERKLQAATPAAAVDAIKRRFSAFRDACVRGTAITLLNEWRDETLRKLQLDGFALSIRDESSR